MVLDIAFTKWHLACRLTNTYPKNSNSTRSPWNKIQATQSTSPYGTLLHSRNNRTNSTGNIVLEKYRRTSQGAFTKAYAPSTIMPGLQKASLTAHDTHSWPELDDVALRSLITPYKCYPCTAHSPLANGPHARAVHAPIRPVNPTCHLTVAQIPHLQTK